MAKRFQPMKEFGRSMKKPKLDFCQTGKRSSPAGTSKAAAYKADVPSTQKDPLQSAADLWDDEEDDILLLATQVAESEIASKPKNPETRMEITESEITFSEFEPKVKQHSTQRVSQADLFSQMFDDDDDDIASLAAAIEKDAKKAISSSADDEVFFKKPTLQQRPYTKSSISTYDEQPGPSNKAYLMPSTQSIDTSAADKKQLASEQQIKFLMERLEAVKQENANLSKELTDVKETVQTKTGEASMLRDELRHTKQKLDEIKMEKMFQSETVNTESKNKIEELSKKVKDKESQLQLKSMECSVLKMRQADETRRFDTTTRDTTMTAEANANEEDSSNADISFELSELVISDPPPSIESNSIMLTKCAFERSEAKSTSSKWDKVIQKELENLQRFLAQMQLKPDEFALETSKQLIESVRKVFLGYYVYVQTLDFGFHQTVLPQHEYNVLEDTITRSPGCLHFKNALSPGECSVHIRRYIAILAVICEKSSQITHILLAEKHEGKPLFNVAIDAINKLGFSLEVCLHFGALEAFAVLLRSIILHLDSDDEDKIKPYFELVTNFFKQLVFARPNPWTLLELSYSILDIAYRLPFLFSLFCVNSPRDTFVIDRAKGVYRFSSDSCLIQVYCGLLEAAFPLYVPLTETIFELQTKICLNHVRFVFYCLTDQPEFVEKMLSTDEDDDECDDSNADGSTNRQFDANKDPNETFKDEKPTTSKNVTASSTKESSATNVTSNTALESSKAAVQCQCFEQLCLTAVRMVWLSLRQWLRMEKFVETDQIATISRVAVHLLHLLFCDNYLACLFREDEDTTKHFIYLICHWWLENEEDLKFSEIQANLLKKIKNSHVVPKLFYEEEAKPENIAADLAEWCRLTNDKIDLSNIDTEKAIKNLRLEEDLADPEIFFDLLKERPINMEAYDFS